MSSKYNGPNGGVLGEIRATGSLSSGDNTTSNLNQVQNNHQMISNSSVKVSGGVNSNVNRQTMKNSKKQRTNANTCKKLIPKACPTTLKRTQCSGRQHQSAQIHWQAQWNRNIHNDPPLGVLQFPCKLQHMDTSRAQR